MSLNLPDQPINSQLTEGQEIFLLQKMAEAYGVEKARQEALSKVYTAQEAAVRLKRKSMPTVYDLLKMGKFGHVDGGESSGYLITEEAIRKCFRACKKVL
ncbi:hypothetical protein [Adhaeribacter aquaticus]|uniref:hypothetical protein n=1 Tax=Adhaeribacter aquaticus TaxID=299567 RepID=UPI00040DA395|nr:hypothetical protein [Adhaeribacter aquaticus]